MDIHGTQLPYNDRYFKSVTSNSANLPVSEVSRLSLETLEDLISCDDKLMEFVDSMPQLIQVRVQCDQLMEQNEALAQDNLNHSQQYEQTRDCVIRKVEELATLQSAFQTLTLQHQKLSEKLAPSSIQESMLIAACQSEEESDQVAENFLNKEVDVDTFLSSYLHKRKDTYVRKFKGDRLGSQLRELQRAGF